MKAFKNKLLWRDTFLCTLFTLAFAGLFLLLFVNLSVLDPFYKAFKDFSFTDIYYSKGFYKDTKVDDVIIVNVKHHNRFEIAQAINKVSEQNPKVIGLDIVFKEQKEPFFDSILKASLNHKSIVTSYFVDGDSTISNHLYFKTSNETSGFINVNLSDQDVVIRDFVGVQSNSYSFATQIAIKSGLLEEKNIKKLEERIPINYIGNENSFLSFDIDEILENDSIEAMNNAIVIFGYLGTPTNNPFDIEDKHFTPLNKKFAGRSTPDMYGVLIHANIVKMLTQNNFITKIPKAISYIIAIIFCFSSIFWGMLLYKRSEVAYDVFVKLIQLATSIILLYLALLLLKLNVYIFITPILVLSVFGFEIIDFYVYIVNYLNKKFQWKSYLLE